MEIGKVPEAVLERSVIGRIKTARPEALIGAAAGEDCAALSLNDDEIFVLSADPITGTAKDIGRLAIMVTANDLASAGAEPVGVMLTVLLPEQADEAQLRDMMDQAELAAHAAGVQILGGHTEVTRAVVQPVISVAGIGKVKKGRLISTGGARPGMDIIVTKWIGLEGTSIIAKEKERELLTRYPHALVDEAKSFDQYLSVLPEARIAAEYGAAAMHDVTEGGIFGALWEMGERSGVGLEIDLKEIPIRQETVEVCEFFDINPYELIGSGSMLIAANDGGGLVRALHDAGIASACIGKATRGNDRVVISGARRRFLTPPKTDELYKVVG